MHKINKETGCLIWEGKTCSSGRYGRLPGSPMKMAHREAYRNAKGDIPRGYVVMHTCDVGLCVNPEHLILGTQSDNMKDAASKKRLPHLLNQAGESNSRSKYTMKFAEELRRYYEENKCTYRELAEKFGLASKGHAYNIVKKRIWK